MRQRITTAWATMRAAVLVCLGAAFSLISGCAQPIGVKIVDSATGTPIAGASITRSALLRPYFIVSAFVPVEQCETDSDGLAQIKDRDGSLQVKAPGYAPKDKSLVHEGVQVVIELDRVDDGGQSPDN